MPNWKTHLEISKRLNEELNYKNEDLELFNLGSILPDINNGHLVKEVSKVFDHTQTHFSQTEEKSYIYFSNKYKVEISNPLVLGMYTHLYTDYYWNNNFHLRAKTKGLDKEEKIKKIRIKQHDFLIYSNKFLENTITIDNMDLLLKNVQMIKEVSINKKDLENSKKFLDNQKFCEGQYIFYTEEELDVLKEEVIINLKEYIKKLK